MNEPMWRRYLRFFGKNVDADIDDEMQFHFAERVEQYRSEGMSEAEATRRAEAQFGEVAAVRRRLQAIGGRSFQRSRRAEWWDAFRQDLAYATRGIRLEPLFAGAVILTLALGIGANAAIFGIVNQLLFKPPALIQDPAHVSHVYFRQIFPGQPPRAFSQTNYPLYAQLPLSTSGISHRAGYAPVTTAVGEGADAWSAEGTLVTSGFFELLGVRPALGRFLLPAEEDPAAADPGIVISHEVWVARFGKDPSILERRLNIRGHHYEVVGVAPPGFTGVELTRTDLWLPMSAAGRGLHLKDWNENKYSYWLRTIVRTSRAGSDAAAAQATMTFQRWLLSGEPFPDSTGSARVLLGPIHGARNSDMGRTVEAKVAAWLAGIAGIVLVIACANVANLLLLRGMRRRKEIALRQALGMSGGRLVRQLCTEGFLLAGLGGVAALGTTYFVGGPLRSLLVPDIVWTGQSLDSTVLALTAAAILMTALMTGMLPAFSLRRTDLTNTLKAGGGAASARRPRTQLGLLLAQTALSVLLLVAAGLFLKSLGRVRATPMGFDADRVLGAAVEFPASVKATEVAAFYDRALDRVRLLPGVLRASISVSGPFGSAGGMSVRVPGRENPPENSVGGPWYNTVSPEFFATLGTRLLDGREFVTTDRKGTQPVVIINQTMAETYWPGERAVGKCFYAGDDPNCLEVVGVTAVARQWGVKEDPAMQLYLPLAQSSFSVRNRQLFIRTAGEADLMTSTIRRSLLELSPLLPYTRIYSLQSRWVPQTRPWIIGAVVLTAFGLLAVVISAVGLYSVIGYAVAQRTKEMGIRLALGARAVQITRGVMADGVRLAVVGTVVGVAGALLLGRFLADLLFETAPNDPWVLGGAVAVLVTASIFAALGPARRAGRADPMITLRAE